MKSEMGLHTDHTGKSFYFHVSRILKTLFRLNVAKLAQIPDSVLRLASEKSAEMETITKERKLRFLSKTLAQVVGGADMDQMTLLVLGTDELEEFH